MSGEIKHLKYSNILHVTVPEFDEFAVNEFAKKYYDDLRISNYFAEIVVAKKK